MPFEDLQQFIAQLERTRQLQRVKIEVDPVLEAGEIAQRVLQEGGPALLFERPKGASMPLVMNRSIRPSSSTIPSAAYWALTRGRT